MDYDKLQKDYLRSRLHTTDSGISVCHLHPDRYAAQTENRRNLSHKQLLNKALAQAAEIHLTPQGLPHRALVLDGPSGGTTSQLLHTGLFQPENIMVPHPNTATVHTLKSTFGVQALTCPVERLLEPDTVRALPTFSLIYLDHTKSLANTLNLAIKAIHLVDPRRRGPSLKEPVSLLAYTFSTRDSRQKHWNRDRGVQLAVSSLSQAAAQRGLKLQGLAGQGLSDFLSLPLQGDGGEGKNPFMVLAQQILTWATSSTQPGVSTQLRQHAAHTAARFLATNPSGISAVVRCSQKDRELAAVGHQPECQARLLRSLRNLAKAIANSDPSFLPVNPYALAQSQNSLMANQTYLAGSVHFYVGQMASLLMLVKCQRHT